ncbi:MAG: SDR family oxidoreductase [Bryobacter sp.]|nr:SDR family oxidoreductase [Bryobacter sp.]
MTFSGKNAVVTGGASGIGLATARLLQERGASVVVWDRNSPPGEALLPFRQVDLTNPEEVQEASGSLSSLDMLVHSAGVQTYGTALTTSADTWRFTMAANVDAGFYVSRALLPLLRLNRGSIVMVGSVQSVGAVANSAAYVTSKHAILGLTRSLALDFAADGVRTNCICPGAIDTPMLRHSASLTPDPEGTLEACAKVHPLGRLGTPEEIARAIAFLASDDASFITGTAFMADGGALVPVGGMAFQENGTARARG